MNAYRALLLPMLSQVLLTSVLASMLGYLRQRAIRQKTFRIVDRERMTFEWPQRASWVAASYANQFEMPVLFFAGCIVALIVGEGAGAVVYLAWGFAAARWVQSMVHITTNYIPLRFVAFITSVACVVGMWGALAAKIVA